MKQCTWWSGQGGDVVYVSTQTDVVATFNVNSKKLSSDVLCSHHHQAEEAPDSPLGVTLRHQGLVEALANTDRIPWMVWAIKATYMIRMLAQSSHITVTTAGATERDEFPVYSIDENLNI